MFLECLEYLDLSFDFAFFDRFEYFDDNIFIILYSNSHVDLRILALSNFGDDLVLINVARYDFCYPYSIS